MTATAIKLDLWSMRVEPGDGYTPPEQLRRILVGTCYGHPRHPDGKQIETARIVKIEGRFITTSSGSVYRLARIDPGYRRYLRKRGLPYNAAHPVRFIEELT